MTRKMLAVLALLAATAAPLRAYEEVEKPIGTWTRTTMVDDQQVRVRIEVKADTIRCTARAAKGLVTETLTVEADYFITRDGVVMGMVPLGKKTAKAADKEALKDTLKERGFMCRFKLDKHGLVISELVAGGDIEENVKKVLEGKYRKVEEKAAATYGRRRSEPALNRPGVGAAIGAGAGAVTGATAGWAAPDGTGKVAAPSPVGCPPLLPPQPSNSTSR
jgi:hypothetical protein